MSCEACNRGCCYCARSWPDEATAEQRLEVEELGYQGIRAHIRYIEIEPGTFKAEVSREPLEPCGKEYQYLSGRMICGRVKHHTFLHGSLDQ